MQMKQNELRLFLLDGFDLTVDDQSQQLQPAMQRLIALVALGRRGITRERAAFQLWPDKSEERSKANLRSCLWRLGKLPFTIIDAGKTALRLNSGVWVDVREGIEELSNGDDDAVTRSLLPFQALQSDLLPDWYDDWLVVERERFRQLRTHALESQARRALSDGDSAAAIQLALASAAIAPQRESAHRLAAAAHLAEGNSHEARNEYARFCDFVSFGPRDGAPEFETWISQPIAVTVQ